MYSQKKAKKKKKIIIVVVSVILLLAVIAVVVYTIFPEFFFTASPPAKTQGSDTGIDTCADGIKNGKESGVDCGGRCKPCGSSAACLYPKGAKTCIVHQQKKCEMKVNTVAIECASMSMCSQQAGEICSKDNYCGGFNVFEANNAPMKYELCNDNQKLTAEPDNIGNWWSNVYYDRFEAAEAPTGGCLFLPDTDQTDGFYNVESTQASSLADCNEKCYDESYCLAFVYDQINKLCFLSPTLPELTDAKANAFIGTPCDMRNYYKCNGGPMEREILTARVCKVALAQVAGAGAEGTGQTENGQKCMLKEGSVFSEICSRICSTETQKMDHNKQATVSQIVDIIDIDPPVSDGSTTQPLDKCNDECNANPRCRSYALSE